MTIDWINLTPWSAIGGGLLIGTAASAFIMFNGRIAGISGILAGLMRPARGDILWRLAFLVGLLIAPLLYQLVAPLPHIRIEANSSTLVVAGLLVGLGTRYGAGCTSGHGVCGLARRSVRSLVATASFMAAGFAVVFVVRHVLA